MEEAYNLLRTNTLYYLKYFDFSEIREQCISNSNISLNIKQLNVLTRKQFNRYLNVRRMSILDILRHSEPNNVNMIKTLIEDADLEDEDILLALGHSFRLCAIHGQLDTLKYLNEVMEPNDRASITLSRRNGQTKTTNYLVAS